LKKDLWDSNKKSEEEDGEDKKRTEKS